MDVTELKERDPKRFEKEYWAWTGHTLDYDWYEYVYENFKTDCNAVGVIVHDIQFSGFWSQGDGATFSGRVYVYEWMAHKGFDVTHPAVYIACRDDGSYVSLEKGKFNNMRANLAEYTCETTPSGMFEGLEQEAWEELVGAQLSDLSIEDEVLSFCDDLAGKLYINLRDEYEHLTSEEMFIEHCEANEITFEENEDAISA